MDSRKSALIFGLVFSVTLTLVTAHAAENIPKQSTADYISTSTMAAFQSSLKAPSKKELDRRSKLLVQAAKKVFHAIRNKDKTTILAMVDHESGVSSQRQSMVYYQDLKKDLDSEKGFYVCHLFSCDKTESKRSLASVPLAPPSESNIQANSIRELLSRFEPEFLEVDAQFIFDYEWGGVDFVDRRLRKPAQAHLDGEYQRPLLTFRWKNGRWFIFTLFEK